MNKRVTLVIIVFHVQYLLVSEYVYYRKSRYYKLFLKSWVLRRIINYFLLLASTWFTKTIFENNFYSFQLIIFLFADTVKDWQNDVDRKRCPVLFCTDYVLRDLHVYEADCLIHYSLPEHKMEFLFRFSVLLDRLQSLADKIVS